ncbi:hypothetical protein [Photobacterium profundum]|uniref:Uncharacterized protein n=1 Tax=Photobacterium profundum (strain SS9) TaxID=298386 RepID=Q6LIS2_PHOPR|nr:hypothetical protein [Photobacterium profundum]CAG22808.1 hypothetical protein PBPRB0936 [Photobacterium profundum SS9]
MEVFFKERAYYTNRELIPINDVIKALDGLQEVIGLVPNFFEEIDSSLSVIDLKIYIDELKTGSLIEDLLVKVTFGGQDELDLFCSEKSKSIHTFLDKHGVKDKNMRTGLILIVALLIGAGSVAAINKFDELTNSKNKALPTIQANNNIILNIAADHFEEDSDTVKNALDTVVKLYGSDKLSKATQKIIAPAKLETDAELKLFTGGNKTDPIYTFEKSYINAIPAQIDDKSKIQMNYESVKIIIDGMDLISHTSGWRATIPDLSSVRIPITIPRDADLYEISKKQNYLVDLLVIYKQEKDGDLKPVKAHITKFLARQQA